MAKLDFNRVRMQNAADATGNGTAIDVSGYGTLCMQVTGTFVGTVTFEGTLDGTTWVAIAVVDTNGARQTAATATGIFRSAVGGLASVRARVSAYTSGNITVHGMAISDATPLLITAPLPANSGVDIGDVDVTSVSGTVTVDTEFAAAAAAADALANPTTAHGGALNYGFNGTTWDRIRMAAASVLDDTTQPYALLVNRPGDWAATHVPAANTQATTTKTAGAAGVRHIATTISGCLQNSAANAGSGVLNLIDGASGGATYLWRGQLAIPATANSSDTITLGGLNVFGTAATAMTLEFAAAGGANTLETVALTGYSVGG